ncbi:MAG TPA: NUDIX hydrolase [Alphaproteobacteria bacterium]
MTKLPREEYLQSLDKKPASAGMLFRNTQNEILLVEPTYKENWDIPGGVVEKNESPRKTAKREIKEELSLDIEPGALLCIDYKKLKDSDMDSYQMIFDGGILSDEQIALIRIDPEELRSCSFVSNAKAATLLRPTMNKRLNAAIDAQQNHCTYYLEGGQIIN